MYARVVNELSGTEVISIAASEELMDTASFSYANGFVQLAIALKDPNVSKLMFTFAVARIAESGGAIADVGKEIDYFGKYGLSYVGNTLAGSDVFPYP